VSRFAKEKGGVLSSTLDGNVRHTIMQPCSVNYADRTFYVIPEATYRGCLVLLHTWQGTDALLSG